MAVSRKRVTKIYQVVKRKGLTFCIGKDGPKIYEKTSDRLVKNCSKVVVCLSSEEYIEMQVTIMMENLTDNYK